MQFAYPLAIYYADYIAQLRTEEKYWSQIWKLFCFCSHFCSMFYMSVNSKRTIKHRYSKKEMNNNMKNYSQKIDIIQMATIDTIMPKSLRLNQQKHWSCTIFRSFFPFPSLCSNCAAPHYVTAVRETYCSSHLILDKHQT